MDDSVSEKRNIFFNNELFLCSVKWSDLNDDGTDDMIIMCRFGFWIYYGTPRVTDVVNNKDSELTFSLSQNYPNPFNPSTTITFSIPETRFVSLKVFDVLGREAATLLEEQKPAGTYNIFFYAADLSSGTYIYQMISGEYSSSYKMILVK